MAKDARSQRRRAAVAVLSSLLDEHSLLQELWMQHDTLRGDSVTDIIEYVDAMAGRHGLDVATAKRLYGELFKAVRQPEETLPADPWPMMQALRPAAAPAVVARPAPAPAWRPPVMPPPVMAPPMMPPPMAAPAPVMAPPAWAAAPVAQPWAAVVGADPAMLAPPMAVPMAAPAPSAPVAPAPASRAAAEGTVVFSAMMRALIDELTTSHGEALSEIQLDAVRVLAGSPAPAEVREHFQRAWQRARQHDWRLPGRPEDLAELTRVVHRALEVAFGRVGADQILQRAVQAADRVEEAVAFPPRRLLAAL